MIRRIAAPRGHERCRFAAGWQTLFVTLSFRASLCMLRGVLSKTRFQQLLQFTRKNERESLGMFFVEGWRWLEEALDHGEAPECVLAAPGSARTPREAGLLERARAEAREFAEATPGQLARLAENRTPPGVAALVRWRAATVDALAAGLPATAPAVVGALDGVGDPGNVGTIVRTADWFGASGVLLGPGSAAPTNPKAVRATMGSLFHLTIAGTEALQPALERLRVAGFSTVGATLEGENAWEFSWPPRAVVVVGNEAHGIDPDLLAALDHRVRIPSHGRAESLNAAVAAALLLSDWRRAHPRGV